MSSFTNVFVLAFSLLASVVAFGCCTPLSHVAILHVQVRDDVIHTRWFYNCGASILSDKFALTAASCYSTNPSHNTLFVNATMYNSIYKLPYSPAASYPIKRFILHPGFARNDRDSFHDMAIIEVAEPIQFNTDAQPIPLERKFITELETPLTVGWELQGSFHEGSVDYGLKYKAMSTKSNEYCKARMDPAEHWKLGNDILCVVEEHYSGVIQANIGYPLILDTKLIGIRSWWTPASNGGFVSTGFLRISEYADWIEEIIATNASD